MAVPGYRHHRAGVTGMAVPLPHFQGGMVVPGLYGRLWIFQTAVRW